MNFEWAKPVATELLVIRMSRPFAAKPVLGHDEEGFYMTRCFGLIVASAVCRKVALNR